jgi:alkylation response protein AidB-like acyl-CoA dehydrogenase
MVEAPLSIDPLRDAVRSVLNKCAPLNKLHGLLSSRLRLDASLWQTAAELGWLGLCVPEEYGGSAMGMRELAMVYEELGRSLAILPFAPAQLCVAALVASGTVEQKSTYLPSVAQGKCIATLTSPHDVFAGELIALDRDGPRLRLSGRAQGILCPAQANLILVFAREKSGNVVALLLNPQRDGIQIELEDVGDLTRHLGAIELSAHEIDQNRLLLGDAVKLAEDLVAHGAIAQAADSVGGADRILELTVEYLKIRQQFGRPIGSFQALKHRCADLKVQIDSAKGVLSEALSHSVDTDSRIWASMAKFYACDVYARAAADAVQLHGGIGFTWDHYCHVFLKRAKLSQQMYGGSEWHRDNAAHLLINVGTS